MTDKILILDAASTGVPEIEAMRAVWSELQNHALELAGQVGRRRRAAGERGGPGRD